uniref:Uncharacterized protein n=1 Tax=Anguilla anguilla TaxID=7936 RepID=A0A0E9V5L8_ANGAN
MILTPDPLNSFLTVVLNTTSPPLQSPCHTQTSSSSGAGIYYPSR